MICCICGLSEKKDDNPLIPSKITIKVKDRKGRTRYRKVAKKICRNCIGKALLKGVSVSIKL